MKDVLIPEVLRNTQPAQPNNSQPQHNIKLSKNYNYNDNRHYDVRQEYQTTNNTTTINQNKGGLFRFILDSLLLPFRIIRNIYRYLDKKFDFKGSLKLEAIARKKQKFVNKYLKETNSIYDMEEIL